MSTATKTKHNFKDFALTVDSQVFKNMLSDKIGYVEFTKKDGSDRKMYFTINSKIIERNDDTPVGGGNEAKPGQVHVLEVDPSNMFTSLGWKTLILKNVNVFKVLN